MIMELCMEQFVLKLYEVYINDDTELTLINFKTMSNLAKLVFVLPLSERLQDHWPSGFVVCLAQRNSIIMQYYHFRCESLNETLHWRRVHSFMNPIDQATH